jgi:hypothetical protein
MAPAGSSAEMIDVAELVEKWSTLPVPVRSKISEILTEGYTACWHSGFGLPRMSACICWNDMTASQQQTLRSSGIIDFRPHRPHWGYGGGHCNNRAEVAVKVGEMSGPRFYCRECAKEFPAAAIIDPLPAVA